MATETTISPGSAMRPMSHLAYDPFGEPETPSSALSDKESEQPESSPRDDKSESRQTFTGNKLFGEDDEPVSKGKSKKGDPKDKSEDEEEGNEEREEGKEEEEEEEEKGEDKEGTKERPELEEDEVEQEEGTRKKPIKIKIGDEVLKIKPSALVPVLADGQKLEVPLSDLVASYSSQAARKREGAEITKTKRQLERQKEVLQMREQEMQQWVKKFGERVKDPKQTLTALAELIEPFSEDSPLGIIRDIRNAILIHAKEYLDLTEEQRRVLDLEEELAWKNEREKRQKELEKNTSQQQQLMLQIEQTMQSFGIPDFDDFEQEYQELQSLVKDGLVRIQTIVPQHVGGFYVIRQLVKEHAPSLLRNRETLAKLMRLALVDNPKRDELVQTIEEMSGSSSKSSKKPEKPFKRPQSETKKQLTKEDALL